MSNREEKLPAVYMMASQRNATIYVGVTSNLYNRVLTHKDDGLAGFTQKYGVKNLVWYEFHETMESAIQRETQIKNWKRDWKIKRIIEFNPLWFDLHEEIDYGLQKYSPNVK
jgi:putative endonuclease